MADDNVDIRIKLEQAQRFIADAKKAATAIEKTGKSTERAGARAKKGGLGFRMFGRNLDGSRRAAGKASSAFGGLMRRAAGVAAAYIGIAQARSAVTNTMDLAKATFGLTRATSMSNLEASRWAAQAKTRGIDAKALNMAFGTLSKNMDMATSASGNQRDQFRRLGITTKELKAMGGEISPLMMAMSEGFEKVGPGAKRTRAMMTLIGRGWQTITPMMAGGSKELREHLALADKYGVAFGDSTADKLKSFLAKQREMKMATLGMQVAFTTMIAPALTDGMTTLADFTAEMRSGTGTGGAFAAKLKEIWEEAKPIVTWMGNAAKSIAGFVEKHPALRKVAIAIVAVGVAVKALRFASAITGVTNLLGGLRRLAGTKAGQKAAEAIGSSMGNLWNQRIKPGVTTATSKMKSTFTTAGKQAGTQAGTNVASGVSGKVNAAAAPGGKWSNSFKSAGMILGPLLGAAVAVPVIQTVNDQLNDWVSNWEPGASVSGDVQGVGGTVSKVIPGSPNFAPWDVPGDIKGLFKQMGGPIGKQHGPRGDRIPLWAEHGEYMLRRDIVKKFGRGAIDALNAGDVRGLTASLPIRTASDSDATGLPVSLPSTTARAIPRATRSVDRSEPIDLLDKLNIKAELINRQPIILSGRQVGQVLGREIEDLRARR